jgi:hypothetical protein
MRGVWTGLILLIVFCLPLRGEDGPDGYLKIVKPLLHERCLACHGALKQEGNLRLDTAASMRSGGDSGPAIVAGDLKASHLLERVSSSDASVRMPPEGEPLKPDEIEAIRGWIMAGAVGPENEQPEADPRSHWSFQAVRSPRLPQRVAARALNPVDALLEARREASGVALVAEADRAMWLRRVTLDLVGLPPTRDGLHAFLADKAPDAAERVVDRLLADPRYGERWGRHWMDVWRYSDWYGRRSVPDVMNSYPQIWRWRDWIVQSLNADAPYNDMARDMLAADELKPGDDTAVVATGFLVRNWFKWNYEQWMKDNVEHTGKAFLGMTMNCAHCHDHKYDPISHEDYFRFRAFFEPLELRQDRVPGLPDPGPFKKYVYAQSYGPIAHGMIRVFDEKPDAPTYMYLKGDNRNRIPDKPPVTAGIPSLFASQMPQVGAIELPPEAQYPGLREFIRQEERAKITAELAAARTNLEAQQSLITQANEIRLAAQATGDGTPSAAAIVAAEQEARRVLLPTVAATRKVEEAEARLASLEARIAADDARYRGQGDPAILTARAHTAEKFAALAAARLRLATAYANLAALSAMSATDTEHQKKVAAATTEQMAAIAAEAEAEKQSTVPGETYSPLSPQYPATTTGRRAALAQWIGSDANPLTPRVAVNHIWRHHFGRGIVETPSNFGRQGRPPSHPELLDWLSAELIRSGWSMKTIHRHLVLSEAYRLRSDAGGESQAAANIDPDNRLYWRFNQQRLEAEVIRDSLLAASGQLDQTMEGHEIDYAQGLKVPRRSLYFTIHGEAQMEFLDTFDGPSVVDCYERSASVRPQQALALSNNELVAAQANALASRLAAEIPETGDVSQTDGRFIQAVFEQILGREPTAEEMGVSLAFLSDERQIALTGTAAAQGAVPVEQAEAASRVSLVHVLFNHNDFVTVR